MKKAVNDVIILEGMPETDDRIGKLATKLSERRDAVPFALLDCHDESIQKSGQILIEAGQMLILHRRDETLTQPARREANFVADLADGPVKRALNGTSPLRSLLVVGSGTLSHSQIALIDDEGKTHARADLSHLRPAGEGRDVTLASLHGLRGYDKALASLADHLRGAEAQGSHLLGDLVGMLFPKHEPYDPKPETIIAPDQGAYDAANDIIRVYLSVARQNEAGIIADHDSEFLHDYRVALRKIRSVISLFRGVYEVEQTEKLKARFSELMAPTGRLRDLDVYLLGRDTYYDLLPETLHGGLALMFDIFKRERRQEHRKIARLLESPHYRAGMAELENLFPPGSGPARGLDADHPALDYACGLIWKRYRKVCKIAAAIDDETPDEEVHELRINCKKLRYLMELFAPLFPRGEMKAILTPLKELQENLGLFNDYSVQQGSLQYFLSHHPSKGERDERVMATSIGALIALLHQRQMQERARVVSSFAHFDSPAIRRQFLTLFRGKGA
ncbi:CHAD domain-containing protein [Paracoccus sp. MBLB3053]|uniref:CHAD domain-containing protein n=1 Tax=Paracoccus aurantius TaxID=3073814 RepID=A0ABU2HVX2_9RHOB|nr:CHAD domain-containing protein [Paracoccus sp. MBLB3053]MDS9469199.1 CHAD domain-containing protein [Paracoccus sp. MBLB3053]